MTSPETIARVGIAGWVGESGDVWDTAPVAVLGTIGDDLYLVEIDEGNRERLLVQLVERYARDGLAPRVDIALFGAAGGFFASSLSTFDAWPKSPAELPANVFIDAHHQAAFTQPDDGIVMTVRHALRPDRPPKRCFRFEASKYEDAMRDLTLASRRLRDDLLALARERAPHEVEALRAALALWPA